MIGVRDAMLLYSDLTVVDFRWYYNVVLLKIGNTRPYSGTEWHFITHGARLGCSVIKPAMLVRSGGSLAR